MRILFFTLSVMAAVFAIAQTGDFQKYEIESGYITYNYSGGASGTQKMYWTDFGQKELVESNITVSVMGFSSTENSLNLTLGYTQYSWRKGSSEGIKMENPITREYAELKSAYTEDLHKAVMDSLGYKKEGTEMILGKTADVYVGGLGKFWIWNGFVLKSVVNAMGIEMVIVATEIKLNASVSDSKFALPKGIEFKEMNEQFMPGGDNDEIQENLKELLKQMNGE